MSKRQGTTSPSWNRTASHAVRRWIAIPFLLALLGAGAGVALGYAAKPSAEALLLVQTESTEALAKEQAVENAAIELNTIGFFKDVVRGNGKNPADLQRRTRIAAKPNSEILSIIVTAPTSAQAVDDARAIANEAVSAAPGSVLETLDQLTDATARLIRTQKLTDKTAERARVGRLGDELAAGQAQVMASTNSLQLLQSGEPTRRLPSAPVLGVMGGIVGGLLGLGLVLLLGKRGTVKSERELSELYPRTAVIDPADIKNVISMEPGTSTVILAGTRGARLAGITEFVQQSLTKTTGYDVVVADRLADVPVNESSNGHINLVPTTLSESVVRRASRDESSLLVVPVQPGVTRLQALDEFASRLPDRTYLLVSDRATPAWN